MSAGSRVRVALTARPGLYHAARRATEFARFLARRPHEPDFAAFSLFPDRDGLFLDVGANSGASALSFRLFNRRSPILSIEANPSHRRDLEQVKRLLRGGFDYRLVAAGDQDGEVELWVPFFGETPLTGEASVVRENAESTWWAESHADGAADRASVRPVKVPMIRLDSLGLSPDFVKIDVEGAEVEVLGGLTETLERSRPILLLEIGSDSPAPAYLRERGYRAYRYAAERRALEPYEAGDVQNLFFLPSAAASRWPT